MGPQPAMLDVPVLVLSCEARQICYSNVEVGLIVLEGMTDEGDMAAWNIEGSSDLLEYLSKRNVNGIPGARDEYSASAVDVTALV